MSLWYPVGSHPAGPTGEPWYRTVSSLVVPAAGHPSGPSDHAHYRIEGGHVFSYDDHPKATPAFMIRGSMVYRFAAPGESPWYQIR